jgi:hypothetical protein
MALKDKSTLTSETVSQIKTNSNQEITGAIDQGLRTDMIDSNFNLITDWNKLSIQLPWVSSVTYPAGSYCKYDDLEYVALIENVNQLPTVGAPYWAEVASGGISSFEYLSDVWVSENASEPGVFGDILKPFSNVTDAINAIPTNTPTEVHFKGVNTNWGAGGIILTDKQVLINAEGRDLVLNALYFGASTLSSLTINCNDFTSNAKFLESADFVNINCSNDFISTSKLVESSNKLVVRALNSLSHGGGDLTQTCPNVRLFTEELTLNGKLRFGTGGNVTMSAVNAFFGALITNGQVVNCDIKGLMTATTTPFVSLGNGSVLRGNYDVTGNLINSGGGFTLACDSVEASGDVIAGSVSDVTIVGGSYATAQRLSSNPITDATIIKPVIRCGMVGESVGAYAVETAGTSRIVDAIVEVTSGSDHNGINCTGGTLEVSESHVILPNDTQTAYNQSAGTLTLDGDNSQYPMPLVVPTGTEEIKIQDGYSFKKTLVSSIGGGGETAVINPATPYTPTTGDVIDWDCIAGNKAVDLPDASTNTDMQINISKSDATANTITINALGADTINGSASITVTTQYEVITLFSTGARWLIK